jgi:hypothetical protein
MRLTDGLSLDTGLELERSRTLPGGSVEIVYRVREGAGQLQRAADWAPASQR